MPGRTDSNMPEQDVTSKRIQAWRVPKFEEVQKSFIQKACMTCSKVHKCSEAKDNERSLDVHICNRYSMDKDPLALAGVQTVRLMGYIGMLALLNKADMPIDEESLKLLPAHLFKRSRRTRRY